VCRNSTSAFDFFRLEYKLSQAHEVQYFSTDLLSSPSSVVIFLQAPWSRFDESTYQEPVAYVVFGDVRSCVGIVGIRSACRDQADPSIARLGETDENTFGFNFDAENDRVFKRSIELIDLRFPLEGVK
jgi:hypothetical protein